MMLLFVLKDILLFCKYVSSFIVSMFVCLFTYIISKMSRIHIVKVKKLKRKMSKMGPVGLNQNVFRNRLGTRGVGAIQTIYIQNNFFVTIAYKV